MGELPPNFALLRAVEILAQIAERQQSAAQVSRPPADVPIVLFNEQLMFVIGKTRRTAVTDLLGPGYAFPIRGRETYALREGRVRCLLSALYRDDVLVAVDYAVANPGTVPELRPRDLGAFRLVPGQIEIGMDLLRLDDRFVAVPHGPDRRTYSHSFEARFPGGIVFAQGTGGGVQRLALYEMPSGLPHSGPA